MAIIQISQIKHRRGQQADLPFSLEEGEIGLTLDTGEVFIGTPTLPQAIERAGASAGSGSFPYLNTQLLTEWTENVERLINYQYRSRQVLFSTLSANYVINNDVANPILSYINSNGDPIATVVSRKLQERLDEVVSIKAYGATGNGRKDFSVLPSDAQMNAETAAIRRAALDVSNVTNHPGADAQWKPRALHFPAGVYNVNDSLYLPPTATWLGDGKGNSIVALCGTSVAVSAGRNDCLLFTVDGGLLPEDIANSAAVDAHSYQNIGTSVSALPENILVAGITFVIQRDGSLDTTTPYDIIRLIAAKNVIFYDCEFIGNWSSSGEHKGAGLDYTPEDSIGVVIDSYNRVGPEYKPSNITFVNCDFSDTVYAALMCDDVSNISFSLCKLNRHFRGISISENIGAPFSKTITQGSAGPRFVSLDRNYFTNIQREAILVESVGLTNDRDDETIEFFGAAGVISTFNRFENVGNDDTNGGSLDFSTINPVIPTTSVIRFALGTMNNASIGDNFSRDSVLERTNQVYGVAVSRVESSPLDTNLVINSQDFAVNPVRQLALNPSVTNAATGLRFAQLNNNSVFINYTLVRTGSDDKRIGTMRIIGTDAPAVFLDDDYSEVGTPINVSFNVITDGTTINLRYTNNDADDLFLYYQINKWPTIG